MKTLLSLIALLALTVAAHGQASTNALAEVSINTNSSTNLNCTLIRITVQSCTFDPVSWVPLISYSIEAWADDVDAGVTNRVIVAKKSLTMTGAQLKTLMNAPDPKVVFKSAVLARAKLTER